MLYAYTVKGGHHVPFRFNLLLPILKLKELGSRVILMGSVVALEALLQDRRVWRGKTKSVFDMGQPTGHAQLDTRLPSGGWPRDALSEILLAAPGLGELQLLWPTLSRLTRSGERAILIAPPHIPFPAAWEAAGVDMRMLSLVDASQTEALWAAEQCLRSGSCGAVICWPQQASDRALRRLQVAAETGRTLAFAYRPLLEACNPSPASLRLAIKGPDDIQILKCRGGVAASGSFSLAAGV